MPYRDEIGVRPVARPNVAQFVSTDWRTGLPVLRGHTVTLRELRSSDAPSLFAMLSTEEVSRFISPPPTTVEGFERFIAWTHEERAAGRYVCFAVTISGFEPAIGIIQVRGCGTDMGIAEWGFAIGSPFWGQGVFHEGAELVLGFAFEVLGTHRLEARAAVANGRGQGALRKLGAVQEAVLRQSLRLNGQFLDQALYTIQAQEWQARRGPVARVAARRSEYALIH